MLLVNTHANKMNEVRVCICNPARPTLLEQKKRERGPLAGVNEQSLAQVRGGILLQSRSSGHRGANLQYSLR